LCSAAIVLAQPSESKERVPKAGRFLCKERSMNENSIAAERASATAVPAVTLYEKVAKPAKPKFQQGLNTVISSSQDFVAFGKANLDAVAASGQIWAAGVQDLTKQFASTVNASYEESVATFKALSATKSVREAIDLQNMLGQAAIVKAAAESKKLIDASIKLTEQALAPLRTRVTVAVEGFAKAA
jgi:phasin family protein